MDKVDWFGLVLTWSLTLAVCTICGLTFYEGCWGAGLFYMIIVVCCTYMNIKTTKVIWRRKNEAHD